MAPELVKRVIELNQSLHGTAKQALSALVTTVLTQNLGRVPNKKEVRELLASAKRAIAIEKADRAYIAEQAAGKGNDGKETQTRGGRQVIRKADGLGG